MKKFLLKVVLIAILLNVHVKNALCESARPNIIFILTDDQREDTVRKYMPTIYKHIFNKGTNFTNAYATTPLCGPSRISIYTGLYASEHGMHSNDAKENKEYTSRSIARKLKKAGYYTGLIGKFHNTSNGKYSKNRKQEYDFWASHRGGSARYLKTVVNYNGVFTNRSGEYITNYWNRTALTFLDKAKASKKPFFLTIAHNAPHSPATPADAYKKLYSEKNLNLNAETYMNTDKEGKPLFVRNRKDEVANSEILKNKLDKNIKTLAVNQLRSLKSVDDGFKTLMNRLKNLGLYKDTIIIFMSDNGLMWGEHCLTSKDYIYEESSHVPLAVFYPGNRKMFPRKSLTTLVSNIDLAPTFAELAGIKEKEGEFSGVSLIKSVSGESDREGVLIQGRFQEKDLVYTSYHTKDYIYSEIGDEKERELYDLTNDRSQVTNHIDEPSYSEIQTELKEKFDEENLIHDPKSCYEIACEPF